jgi:parallel beta-helix repeat protein
MKRIIFCLVAVFGLVLSPTYALATTFYVSDGDGGTPNGDDARTCATAQTISTPKKTISSALACLSPGDTLMMRGGVYNGVANTINSAAATVPSGNDAGSNWATTATGAIRIQAYCPSGACESVTIQPPDTYPAIALTTSSPHYLIFQDFIIDMSLQTLGANHGGADGVYLSQAHHNRFQRLEVKNNTANGFHVSDGGSGSTPYNEILHSNIHHVGRFTEPGDRYNNGYGIYAFVTDLLVDGNDIHDNDAFGIHMADNAGTVDISRTIIRNNKVYNNGNGADGCRTAITSPNVCSNYGILVGDGDDILVYNNLVYGNNGGIVVYENSTNLRVYNNTVFGNRDEGIMAEYYKAAPNTPPTIQNNISYGNGSYNIHDYGDLLGVTSAVINHNLQTNPSFDVGAYTITCPGSPACDAGVTIAAVTTDILGNARPSGAAYDYGAYEANATGSPVSITTTTMANGVKTVAYSAPLVITGGTGTYTGCTVSAGSLPTGVSPAIVSNQCVPAGMPSATGSFSFTLQACDNAGTPSCGTRAYSVSIAAVCTPAASGLWSLIECPGASSSNGTADAVSVAVDSSTADLAACAVASDLGAAAPTWSDSKANGWTLVVTTTATFGRLQLYFSRLATVGSGHTFRAATGGAASFAAFQCGLFSGSVASPLDTSIGSTAMSATTIQPGNMISARAEELFIQAMQIEAVSVTSVSLSDAYVSFGRPVSDNAFGVAIGYRTFGSVASNSNPVWSWTPAMGASSVAAAFFATQLPAGVVPLRLKIRRAP